MTGNLKIAKQRLLIALFFAILTFVFLINSPLHPFGNAESGTDSSVFRTIAMMMKKG